MNIFVFKVQMCRFAQNNKIKIKIKIYEPKINVAWR